MFFDIKINSELFIIILSTLSLSIPIYTCMSLYLLYRALETLHQYILFSCKSTPEKIIKERTRENSSVRIREVDKEYERGKKGGGF